MFSRKSSLLRILSDSLLSLGDFMFRSAFGGLEVFLNVPTFLTELSIEPKIFTGFSMSMTP